MSVYLHHLLSIIHSGFCRFDFHFLFYPLVVCVTLFGMRQMGGGVEDAVALLLLPPLVVPPRTLRAHQLRVSELSFIFDLVHYLF